MSADFPKRNTADELYAEYLNFVLERELSGCAWTIFTVNSGNFQESVKAGPSRRPLIEGCQSIILAAFPYLCEKVPGNSPRNLSRYASVPDYHSVCGERLNRAKSALEGSFGGQWQVSADSSPINEVHLAQVSGMGFYGKNRLLITEAWGSWVFLGTIAADILLPEKRILDRGEHMCANCGQCIKACPTQALTENGINTELCLSHITQKKGELTEKEKRMILDKGLIWGCDICQEVCPMNKKALIQPLPEFLDGYVPFVNRENLDEIFPRSAFAWRGRKVIERNLALFEDE